MYQKPDFVKVSLKVKDVFANYSCPHDEGKVTTYTVPDNGCASFEAVYTSMPWGNGCYSTLNP